MILKCSLIIFIKESAFKTAMVSNKKSVENRSLFKNLDIQCFNKFKKDSINSNFETFLEARNISSKHGLKIQNLEETTDRKKLGRYIQPSYNPPFFIRRYDFYLGHNSYQF